MTRILAIDLGKFNSVTCLLDTTSNETEFWTMSTDQEYLRTVLKNYRPDLVVIESCGLCGWVHDVCTAQGHKVLVCNPNHEPWKWKHIKRKTDRDDALKLAKLAALEQLIPVYVPSQRQREYRRLVKYRKVIVDRINRIQNNIRAIFAQRGMSMVRGQKAWALERLDLLAQHRKPLAECSLEELWRGELDLELVQLEQLLQHQHEIHKKLKALAAADERVQLLQTIPGVGRKTAEVVVAYLDDPHRFQNSRQVSSYAGLVPRRYQSGEMDRHGHIHKRGPRQLRGALVEAVGRGLDAPNLHLPVDAVEVVDVHDLRGDSRGERGEQEHRRVPDIVDRHVAPQGRMLLDVLEDLAEAGDAARRERADRPGRDRVDANPFRAQVRGEVAAELVDVKLPLRGILERHWWHGGFVRNRRWCGRCSGRGGGRRCCAPGPRARVARLPNRPESKDRHEKEARHPHLIPGPEDGRRRCQTCGRKAHRRRSISILGNRGELAWARRHAASQPPSALCCSKIQTWLQAAAAFAGPEMRDRLLG